MMKTALTITILAGILILFGLSPMVMAMDDSAMGACPFMAHSSAICPLNFLGHISLIQSISNGLTKNLFSLILAAFILLAAFLLTFEHDLKFISKWSTPEKPETPLFNRFLRALSDGIVQPKVFA